VGLSSHEDDVEDGGGENAGRRLGDVSDVLCHLLAAQALKVAAAVEVDRALRLEDPVDALDETIRPPVIIPSDSPWVIIGQDM
jgi:hypothetical protein